MRVAIYARVSTDGQTVENQVRDLKRWAKNAGHEIVAVFTDEGISGAKGREDRKALDELMKAAVRREFDLVAAWSVDRLGRSLKGLLGLLEELEVREGGPVPPPASSRHNLARGPCPLPDAGRLLRVRAGHDSRTCCRRFGAGQGPRQDIGQAEGGQARGT